MTEQTALMPREESAVIEKLVVQGDLSGLSSEERATYYMGLCRSIGVNALTQPFEYLKLSGRLTLYATKRLTDQLRDLHGVSITGIEERTTEGVLIVTAHARDKTGREDADVGAVSLSGAKGDDLANKIMKATTKAKRRVTLSICGLGMLDETEIDAIPNAQRLTPEGEVIEGQASVKASENPSTSPERAKLLNATGAEINAVAEITGAEPKAVWRLAMKALEITAETTGDLSDEQIGMVREWAHKEVERLHSMTAAHAQSAPEPAQEIEV